MSWNEIHIHTTDTFANEISEELHRLGALAITFKDAGDQPIFEPGPDTVLLWQETIIIALFEAEHPIEPIFYYLNSQTALNKVKQFNLQSLAEENWERRCLEGFEPICCGERLWICPSWHTPPSPEAVNINLDPGLAFGTGTHPTTQLCLEWLDKHIKNQSFIIDYGSGSGILAIAALKLGAKKALAIDIDPQALEATLMNAQRNHLEDSRLIIQPPSMPIKDQADILIANILAKPLVELAYLFSTLIKDQGTIVLSGILKDQTSEVLNAYQPWFEMEKPQVRNDWARLVGKKSTKS